MKRVAFGLSVFGVYFVMSLIEQSVCGTCEYIEQGDATLLLIVWIFALIVLWNLFLHRARAAGLESPLHGAWSLVPFAGLWFLFVPTDWHKRMEP